jgi:hypothetical protein
MRVNLIKNHISPHGDDFSCMAANMSASVVKKRENTV